MAEEKEEGIVLSSVPYEDKHRIISVLTQNSGLISLIAKGISLQKPYLFSLTSPFFCVGEFVYRRGKSTIYPLVDGSILEDFSYLRKDLNQLTYACRMGKAISTSQLPDKNFSSAYVLLKKYIQKMGTVKKTDVLYASFLLKILFVEGVIHLQTKCNYCQEKAVKIRGGESVCLAHGASYGIPYSEEEMLLLIELATSHFFSELDQYTISSTFLDKVQALFQELMG